MSKSVYQPKPKQPFIPKNSASNNKKKKNTFLFYVLIFAFIFWSIGSTLALISFFRNIDKDNDLNIAKADFIEIEQTYIGSNLISSAYCTGNSSYSYPSGNYNFNFKVDFKVVDNTFIITNSDFWIYVPSVNETRAFQGFPNNSEFNLIESPQARGCLINFKIGGNYAFNISLGLNFSGLLTNDISHIVIDSTEPTGAQDLSFYNMVSYFDTNGDFVRFSWKIPTTIDNYLVFTNVAKFDYRLYYLSNVLESNQEYQTGFNNGYNQGINDNQQSIYDDAFRNGYNKGNTKGYSDGYSAGVESANSNTFTNLLFSVVDAPIRVISDILSFEVLGTDLSKVFFMLVSCSVIMFIIKRFI